MTTKSYIDRRSYEECLSSADLPTGAYDSLVFMIVSDKKRNGEFKLYQGKFEYYEIDKAKIKIKLDDNINNMESLKKKVDEYRNYIDESTEKINKIIEENDKNDKNEKKSLNESDKKEIKQLNMYIQKYENQIPDLIEKIRELELIIDKNKKELIDFQHAEYIASNEYYSLKKARNNYFNNNDLDQLRKAVHMSCSNADRLRYGKNYIAPYKGHLLKESESPFSPERTNEMNYNAEYTNWLDDNW